MVRKLKVTKQTAKLAAVLADAGLTMEKIGERLDGLSVASTYRVLAIAKENGWLKRRYECTLPRQELEELKAGLYAKDLPEKIREAYGKGGKHVQEVAIFDSGGGGSEPAGAGTPELEAFARNAAGRVGELLGNATGTIGISWGTTLREIADKIHASSALFEKRAEPLDFVPTCGDPAEITLSLERSASRLVQSFDKVVNPRGSRSTAFAGVTAAIPHKTPAADLGAIRRFLAEMPNYTRVIGTGKNDGLLDKTSGILTSTGTVSGGTAWWSEYAAAQAGMSIDELGDITCGNVAGIFLPKRDVGKAALNTIKRLNDRWTGVTEAQLKSCTARATRSGSVGVTILAVGREKTELVMECIRRELVNRLYIDQHLAVGIERSVEFGS